MLAPDLQQLCRPVLDVALARGVLGPVHEEMRVKGVGGLEGAADEGCGGGVKGCSDVCYGEVDYW